ncbi:MAG: PAS domain S-box protein, partial [Nitrospiria bacterium]
MRGRPPKHPFFRVFLVRAAVYFIPAALLAGLVLLAFHSLKVDEDLTVHQSTERVHLNTIATEIIRDFKGFIIDLNLLSSHYELTRYLESDGQDAVDALTQEFLAFAKAKPAINQIRVIDLEGRERIRINSDGGQGRIVPAAALQDKSHRYYFEEIKNLSPDTLYLSPIDLNMEHGQMEFPPRPVTRLGKPLFDSKGQRRGLLVLNMSAEQLIAEMSAPNTLWPTEDYWLIGSNDYWITKPLGASKWQFIHQSDRLIRFKEIYPEIWQQINLENSGQFFSKEGLITFKALEADRQLTHLLKNSTGSPPPFKVNTGAKPVRWKILSILPKSVLFEKSSREAEEYLLYYGLISFILGIGAFILASGQLAREDTQKALRDSEARYRSIARISPVGIFRTDAQGRCTYVNQGWRRITGLSSEEAHGTGWVSALHPHDLKRVFGEWEQCAKENRDFNMEYDFLRKDGHITHVFGQAKAERDDEGKVIAYVGTITDITDRKRAEEDLAHSETRMSRL